MSDAAELISLALTPCTVFLAIGVIFLWSPAAARFLRDRSQSPEVGWFTLGVVLGFAGSAADNIYWGLAWLAEFMQWESRDWLFSHGVFSNIPFRQLAGTLAAGCHIRAAISFGATRRLLILVLASVLATMAGLLFFRT